MKLSQIKTKEVRDRVRQSRYKKFIFAFIVLFLILIVSVCFHSYYAQQKAKKNATAKAQQKMENEYKKAKKEAGIPIMALHTPQVVLMENSI